MAPAVAVQQPDDRAELIRCKAPGCHQVLAWRYPSGDLRPAVVGGFVDARGRLTIKCPACGTRWRSCED